MRADSLSKTLFALTLGSCCAISAFADDKPTSDMPTVWAYQPVVEQTYPADDSWWTTFGDLLLDSLITEGQNANYDIRLAARRIEIARADMGMARAAYFPTMGLNAGWSRSRQSGRTTAAEMPQSTLSYFNAGLSMSWEIDLFGKITSQVRQKKAAVQVSRAQAAGVQVSMAAQIASTYMQLRVAQAELLVTQTHAKSQKTVLDVAEARHEAGLESALDVAQAKTVYYSTMAAIPGLESTIQTSINALAVLLGVYPEDIQARFAATGKLPDYKHPASIGIPADLLRRRPDVAEAEASVAEAAAGLGIARKDYLPSLTLEGTIGTSAHNIKDMFGHGSFSYSVAPTLSWTLFSGLSRNYALRAARETLEMQTESYNLTILTAYEEVSNAASTYTNVLRQLDYLEEVVAQAEKELTLSVDLYKTGLTAFINVANAQLTFLQYTDQLVAAKGSALGALVNLYQAAGGGWDVSAL